MGIWDWERRGVKGARGKDRKLKAERVKSWEVRKFGSYKLEG